VLEIDSAHEQQDSAAASLLHALSEFDTVSVTVTSPNHHTFLLLFGRKVTRC
jgi:hypothetical protein